MIIDRDVNRYWFSVLIKILTTRYLYFLSLMKDRRSVIDRLENQIYSFPNPKSKIRNPSGLYVTLQLLNGFLVR